MAATWMASTGIKAMLIDKKAERTQVGHADGVESRTLEILDSFGLAESIYRDANLTIDLCLWVSECILFETWRNQISLLCFSLSLADL
jgi:phenol 2-monooxygenase